MEKELRKSGIDIIGNITWNTHLCLFYQTKEDLIDIVAPYFKAGLKSHEYCLWVTSEPLNKEAAEKALRKSLPNFSKYLEKGQIEIIPHTEWYLKGGTFDLQRVVKGWTDKLNQALTSGYEGMRVMANMTWLEEKDWPVFMEYVKQGARGTDKGEILFICAYSLDRCGVPEIIDVVSSHQFAVIMRNGKWDTIERYERQRMEKALSDRIKELRCLYDIANISGAPNITLQDRFTQIANLLPKAFQYPDIACVRISVNDSKFNTCNYEDTTYKMSAEINIQGLKAGSVEVCYVKAPPEGNGYDGPFLKEERLLLDAVAERLGAIAEHRQAEEALRESEEKFSKAFHTSPNLMVITTLLDGKIIEVNENFFRFSGYNREDVIGLSTIDLDVWANIEDRDRILQILAEEGKVSNKELYFKKKSGETHPMLFSAELINIGGEPCLLAEGTDISDLKRAEENTIIQRNLGMVLSATNSLDVALKQCLDAAIKVSEMDCGGIYLMDRTTRDLNLAHHRGLSPTFVNNVSHFNDDSAHGLIVMKGEPVYSRHEDMGVPLNKPMLREGIRAVAVVPIKHEGEVIACLNVGSHTRDEVPSLSRDYLETIASMAGSTITRINAEEAMRESEEKFSKAFRASPDIFSITTLEDGRYIDVNDSFTYFTGHSREDVIGKTATEIGGWINPEERTRMIKTLKKHSRVRNVEVESITKSGEVHIGQFSAELIDIGGKPYIISAITDITEQKQSQELLHTVYQNSPLGIYIVQDEKLQYTNPQFQKLTGYSEKALLGKNLLSLVAVEDSHAVKSSTIFTLQEEIPYPCEYRIINKTGQIKWVLQTVVPIHYQGREAILGNLMDITERKYLERKVIEYEELSKMKSNLLATVSHELRTPLATIKGYSTMILDYYSMLSTDEKRDYLKSIDSSTDRLAKLVDNLLDTSRMEAGLLRLEKTSTSIRQLIQRAMAEASVRANHHHIVMRLGRKLPRVNIDAKRIRQVLDNLVDNAIKYSPKGTEILISAKIYGHELLISVTDQGSGIPSEELTNIFDRMYRIEQRLSSGVDGVGLGLYICQRLVEAHGGRIWAESAVNKGSTIQFTLPLTNKEKSTGVSNRNTG